MWNINHNIQDIVENMRDIKVHMSILLFGKTNVLLELCSNWTNLNISESRFPEGNVLIVDL